MNEYLLLSIAAKLIGKSQKSLWRGDRVFYCEISEKLFQFVKV